MGNNLKFWTCTWILICIKIQSDRNAIRVPDCFCFFHSSKCRFHDKIVKILKMHNVTILRGCKNRLNKSQICTWIQISSKINQQITWKNLSLYWLLIMYIDRIVFINSRHIIYRTLLVHCSCSSVQCIIRGATVTTANMRWQCFSLSNSKTGPTCEICADVQAVFVSNLLYQSRFSDRGDRICWNAATTLVLAHPQRHRNVQKHAQAAWWNADQIVQSDADVQYCLRARRHSAVGRLD